MPISYADPKRSYVAWAFHVTTKNNYNHMKQVLFFLFSSLDVTGFGQGPITWAKDGKSSSRVDGGELVPDALPANTTRVRVC